MPDELIHPIYVLFGADEFLRDHYRREIVAAVLAEDDPQTALTRFEGDPPLADVMDELRTLPMMGTRRLVIVSDADPFVSAHREKLEDYLQKPARTGSLLLEVSRFPSNTRLYKAVAKAGRAISCAPPDAKDLPRFFQSQAAALERKIDRQAVDLLCEWIGPDLGRGRSEMEKLALYSQGRDTITADDVSAVVVATAGANPFALSDSLTSSNAAAALEVLESLLSAKGEEYRVLGLVSWHLRRVLKAKQMQQAGQAPAAILKSARIFGRGQRPFMDLLNRRSLDRLGRDFRQLLRTDLALKSGQDARAALQRLIVSLC